MMKNVYVRATKSGDLRRDRKGASRMEENLAAQHEAYEEMRFSYVKRINELMKRKPNLNENDLKLCEKIITKHRKTIAFIDELERYCRGRTNYTPCV